MRWKTENRCALVILMLCFLASGTETYAQVQADPSPPKRLDGPFPRVVVSVPWNELARARQEKAAQAVSLLPQASPDTVRHVHESAVAYQTGNGAAPPPKAAAPKKNAPIAGRTSVPQRAKPAQVATPRRLSNQPYQSGVDVVQISSLQQRPRNHRPVPDENVIMLERNLRQLLIIEDDAGRFTGLWMQVPGIKKTLDQACRSAIAESRRQRRYLREVPRACRIEQLRKITTKQAALLGRAPDGTVKGR